MGTTTKTYATIDDLRAALPDLPEDAVIRDRDGDVERRGVVPRMEGRYAPYTVTYEVPDGGLIDDRLPPSATVRKGRAHIPGPVVAEGPPAPLDPSKVKAGDTSDALAAAVAEFLDTSMAKANPRLPAVRKMHAALTDHQPAPEPEPEWKRGQVAVVTPSMVRGEVTRAIRSADGNWHTDGGGFWEDDEVIDVRPLVVIDPAGVDWRGLQAQMSVLVTGSEPFRRAGDILAVVRRELGIEVTR